MECGHDGKRTSILPPTLIRDGAAQAPGLLETENAIITAQLRGKIALTLLPSESLIRTSGFCMNTPLDLNRGTRSAKHVLILRLIRVTPVVGGR
jgi:hypothetical protein